MSFVAFVRKWFGAKTPAIEAQSPKPDPSTDLKDRAEILLEDLNDFEDNVAQSLDSIPGSFLTVGGNRSDPNVDILTGGGSADALHSHSSMAGDVIRTVRNVSGALIVRGVIVAVVAQTAGVLEVVVADKDDASRSPGFAMAREDIADGATGEVVRLGTVAGLDTSILPLRATLYLGNSGAFATAEPAAGLVQIVGHVTVVDASLGAVFADMDGPLSGLAASPPPGIATTSSAGSSGRAAREDHTHAFEVEGLATSAPPDVATASSVGTSVRAARENHTHAFEIEGLAASPPPAVAPASDVGASARAAREDHTHAAPVAAAPVLMWGNKGWGAGTATRYADPFWSGANAASDALQMRVPRNGTLRNLFVLARSAGSGDFTAQLRVNDVPTALAVNVATGVQQAENTADSIAVNQGDRIDMEIVRTASGSPSDITILAEFA